MKINYLMPEFAEDKRMNILLLDLCKKYPEIMRPQVNIYGFYGSFPGCIWNGGRLIFGRLYEQDEIREIFNIYNNYYNIPLRLTFTNPYIEEKHCYDTYANLIAECGHNGKNEILVNSPILEKYLRENYPNYKYCKSVTTTEQDIYNVKDYYMSVIPKHFNNDFENLSSFPLEDRAQLEIICNDDCIDKCPYTYKHYEEIGKSVLEFQPRKEAYCVMKIKTDFPYKALNENKQKINYDDIINKYLPLNYQYFKLCGRGDTKKRKMNWINYIIRPEYHEDILYKII